MKDPASRHAAGVLIAAAVLGWTTAQGDACSPLHADVWAEFIDPNQEISSEESSSATTVDVVPADMDEAGRLPSLPWRSDRADTRSAARGSAVAMKRGPPTTATFSARTFCAHPKDR